MDRQVGQELAVRIIDVNRYGVGDDVLRHRRVEPDLAHYALEYAAGKRVYRKLHGLALGDITHVRLVDVDPCLYAPYVVGDEEEAGGSHRGHDRLTYVYPPVDHNALDGGPDRAVVEVQPGCAKGCTGRVHGGERLFDGGFR